MAKLYFTGNDVGLEKFQSRVFSRILSIMKNVDGPIGLDTETNFVENFVDRELKVIAITTYDSVHTWVIEYELLEQAEFDLLAEYMKSRLCIIHNVTFDYAVLKKYGVVLEKVWCTMLAEQVLNNGYSTDKGYYSLKGMLLRRFQLDISKEEQTSFGSGHLTDNQVIYAATDTLKLPDTYKAQVAEMKAVDANIKQRGNRGLYKTIWWENEFAKVVGDMESEGVIFDKERWYKIEEGLKPILDDRKEQLNKILVEDFEDYITEKGCYSKEDRQVKPIHSSSAIKKEIISRFLLQEPESTSVKALREFLKEVDPTCPADLGVTNKKWTTSAYATQSSGEVILDVIKAWSLSNSSNKEDIEAMVYSTLLQCDRQFLIDLGVVQPGGKVLFNWGSPAQKQELFNMINIDIPNTKKDTLLDYIDDHRIFQYAIDYADANYQINSFGKSFYDKHVEPDGKFRTRFNQILKTGRLSSVKPNLLNIPRKGDLHRKALVPEEGCVIINADYDGQELAIVTDLANVSSWKEYSKLGYDLHSMNASLIFGEEWEEAKEEGCRFYKDEARKKCKCSGHVQMRDKSKAATFGSIYGIAGPGLAAQLKCSIKEANFILERFFTVVPEVRIMMDKFGSFGIRNGYIIEPVFGRIRYFDQWKLAVDKEAAGVARASFNSPIQSAGSSILKIAFVLMRRQIKRENLERLIKLLLPYHDETLAQSKNEEEIIKKAKQIVEHCMQFASKVAGFNIGAGAAHGMSWYDAH